jgi:exopolysaccharide biosynthesis polyprenyl glycosylphosphotransferase
MNNFAPDSFPPVEKSLPNFHLNRRLLRRKWRTLYSLLAIAVDACTILLCHIAAYWVTLSGTTSAEVVPSAFEQFGLYGLLLYMGVAVISGLYRSCYRSSLRRQFRIAASAYFYGSILYVGLILLFNLYPQERQFVPYFFILLPVVFAIERFFLNRFNLSMLERGFGVSNTLIAGIDEKAIEVYGRLVEFPELGYNVKGFISNNGETGKAKVAYYPLVNLAGAVDSEGIECIILPVDTIGNGRYQELESLCASKNIRLKILSPLAEQLLEKANVHDLAGITLYTPRKNGSLKGKKLVKRVFDIFVSVISLIMLSPLLLLIAVAIKLESRGPVLFRQSRALAKGSKNFTFYKFRTMIEGAENHKDKLYPYNESNGALFKIKDDPRRTRVGRFLRRWSLDEFPQLLNVLKGEMSLVGPRPLPVEDLERLAAEESLGGHYTRRAQAVPGVTGIWQVSGRSDLGFTEMVLLDLYYIENQSLILDLEILFATIPVVLFGKGAY